MDDHLHDRDPTRRLQAAVELVCNRDSAALPVPEDRSVLHAS